MTQTYLFAGASSAIAQATLNLARKEARHPDSIETEGVQVIGLTTKSNLSVGYDHLFSVADYTKNSLPDLAMPLDGLVYFPGTINLKPFNRLSEDDFLNEYRLNALGAVAVIQKYLPNLKQAANPSVVLLSTVAVAQGMPYHASISMAKAAIEGLTLALAAEYAPTMRFNAVAPSLTQTPLAEKLLNAPEKMEASNKRHPLKRIGQAVDIAQAIHFLLSEKSAWITGQIFKVDGGMSSIRSL